MVKTNVKDMNLTEFRRKEVSIAEHQMPEFMECSLEFSPEQPFKDLNIDESLHHGHTDCNVWWIATLPSPILMQIQNDKRGVAYAMIE